MLTEQLLDRLAATWRAHNVPVEEALAPGTDVSSFTSDDGRLHIELPAELRAWWAWHDGGSSQAQSLFAWQMGPLLQPLSSRSSRDRWQRSMAMAKDVAADAPAGTANADPEYWWRSSWVPLFSDGSGYLVGDCEIGGQDVAPIRRVEWGPDLDVVARPRTDSFGQLVEWWIEAIELGLWTFDHAAGMWVGAPWEKTLSERYEGLIV
jgi:cell wall assembly regulator SMI1